jgi:hypothetical protein
MVRRGAIRWGGAVPAGAKEGEDHSWVTQFLLPLLSAAAITGIVLYTFRSTLQLRTHETDSKAWSEALRLRLRMLEDLGP